jgi:hypothetical protein
LPAQLGGGGWWWMWMPWSLARYRSRVDAQKPRRDGTEQSTRACVQTARQPKGQKAGGQDYLLPAALAGSLRRSSQRAHRTSHHLYHCLAHPTLQAAAHTTPCRSPHQCIPSGLSTIPTCRKNTHKMHRLAWSHSSCSCRCGATSQGQATVPGSIHTQSLPSE